MSLTLKICLSLLAIVAIYSVAQYLRSRHYAQIGIQLAEQTTPYEQHPTNPTHHFLVIGDSTAVGTGASSPTDSTAGLLGKDYPTADIINRGVNGSRVVDLTNRFTKFSDDQFDLVLIQIGGNDIVRFTDFTALESDLITVLTEANRVGKQVVILHCGNFGTAKLLPFGSRWIFTQRTAKLRSMYQRLAPQYQAQYVDLWRLGDTDPFARDPKTFYAADYFHPSSAGYADWYSFIRQTLPEFPTID
ncbi:MAG: SGNH/GDSL hydrolase family protein [Candidatus Kerfeldbacteria bacterium]|nr:SGNH/GDSL hydrolase family protein [Candidatus Kerfeldbacteria bacterium]